MRVILTTLDGNLYPLEVSNDLEIINLKALCEQETQIPINEISLTFDGRPLNDDNKTLESYGLKDHDMIMVQKIMTNLPLIDFSSIQVPSQAAPTNTSSRQSAATNFRDMILSDPNQFAQIQQRFPQLASAIQRGDTALMTQLLGQLASQGDYMPQQDTAALSGNLFDRQVQERIAEAIRLQNVQQNMESALEHMPEAFGHIVMLYINCRVNGHPVKAFVDSGAQMTIMSGACAERCGIMRLVDKRWAGIAKGVGTQKIVGRVHLAQIQIENTFLPTAFSILEDQPMDMLLGLDLLRRHQCIIDLHRNVLVIKSADVETRFLAESELPGFARLNSNEAMEEELLNTTAEATNTQPSTSTSTSSTSGNSKHSEDKIQELLKLGYSRNDSINALNACNGDVNMAKINLLAKSIQLPGTR